MGLEVCISNRFLRDARYWSTDYTLSGKVYCIVLVRLKATASVFSPTIPKEVKKLDPRILEATTKDRVREKLKSFIKLGLRGLWFFSSLSNFGL